ncbi:unnamed protein product [Trichogramma brassicae]|uniref:Reverse transcriptase domain-containing protein n=1 Tax=Trichogramma brassicae TaxID=86971 RepID=A0A6H5ICL3_9HYME|nr:unnamed protein product [Trichogramma brassicae]
MSLEPSIICGGMTSLANYKGETAKRTSRLVQSYLQDRRVTIQGTNEEIRIGLSKGCPQGSILGPSLWNLCADGLLQTIESVGGTGYMYADDLVILVMANSKRELVRKAQPLVDSISAWFRQKDLQISKTKTEMQIRESMLKTKWLLSGRAPKHKVYLRHPTQLRFMDQSSELAKRNSRRCCSRILGLRTSGCLAFLKKVIENKKPFDGVLRSKGSTI